MQHRLVQKSKVFHGKKWRKSKQILTVALGAFLLLMSLVPVFAADRKDETLQFDVWIEEEGEKPGIYGTLSSIPEGTMSIDVMYSFGGESFDVLEDFQWDLADFPEGKVQLTQLCMGADEHPFKVYQREAVNSLYIKLYITREGGDIETEAVRFSHNKTYPIPEIPPPFTAQIEMDVQGYYQVNGKFTEFPPNVMRVRPMYSLDGEKYHAVDEWISNDWYLNDLGTEEAQKQYFLENQLCVMAHQEPLKSYLDKKLDQFYIRLQITTEDGVSYDTRASLIERGTPKPLPEDRAFCAAFPFTMRAAQGGENPFEGYGQYQITAREDATADHIRTLLPDTLPVEVKILEKSTGKFLTSGIVQCAVKWKTFPPIHLSAGEAFTIEDAVETLVVPPGAEVITPLGIYTLSSPLLFDDRYSTDEVRLVINAVFKDAKPNVALKEKDESSILGDSGALSLAFREKPSGAVSIKAYSFVEEGDEWIALCDLLDERALNHNQAASLYGYVNLLKPDESPLKDYKDGKIPGFFIGLMIEGGVFDGERVVLPWPGDYNPPEEIIEPGSSEGNENNAGSGGNGDDNDSNGGLHPSIPEEDKPPAVVLPKTELEQPAEPGKVTLPPLLETNAPFTQKNTAAWKTQKNKENDGVSKQKEPPELKTEKQQQEETGRLKQEASKQNGLSTGFLVVLLILGIAGSITAAIKVSGKK